MADKLTAESQKCDMIDSYMKILKVENVDLNGRLMMVLSELDIANKMTTRLKKLDDIMCSQKTKTNKYGIGYAHEGSSFNAKGKNCLFQSSIVTKHADDVEHGDAKKKNVSRPDRIPTCHHCGTKGYIRPYRNKLRSSLNQKQWK